MEIVCYLICQYLPGLYFKLHSYIIIIQFNLFPHLTVMDNVTLGPIYVRGWKPQKSIEIATQLLERVGILHQSKKYPNQLSGGQQQRVAIARALASEPKVLLMDEPFGSLDVHTKEAMHDFMLDLWQRTKITIFMITHDVEEAVFLSNRIYALGARPGTVRREMIINLPERSHSIKRQTIFHDYKDELMDLLRTHGQEAMTAAA